MATITIRNVPDDIHDSLVNRAATKGLSLQAYLLRTLIDASARPDLEEWLEAVRSSVTEQGFQVDPDGVVEMLRESRR